MAEYKNKKNKNYAQRKKNLKNIFFKLALAFFGIAIFIASFYLPKFKIKNIIIENNSALNPTVINIIKNEFDKKNFLIFPSDNIFILKKKNIVKNIIENINSIKSIKISRDFPDSLILNFEEKKTVGVFCKIKEPETAENPLPKQSKVSKLKEKCFLINENGEIFKELTDEEKNKILDEKKLILFNIFQNNGDYSNLQFLKQKKIINLTEFVKNAKKLLNLSIEKIIIKEVDNPIQKYDIYFFGESPSYGKEKWYAVLDDKTDIKIAIENLKLILDSKIKEKRNALEYIDLRLPNKAFFKMKF